MIWKRVPFFSWENAIIGWSASILQITLALMFFKGKYWKQMQIAYDFIEGVNGKGAFKLGFEFNSNIKNITFYDGWKFK